MSNSDKLASCFRETLELKENEAVEELAYQKHPAWDSVAHMRLVAAIETAFDIMLETDQILDMSDYSKSIDIVKSHDIDLA